MQSLKRLARGALGFESLRVGCQQSLLKIPRQSILRTPTLAPRAQKYSGCAPPGASTHPECRRRGILRPAEALAKSPQMPGPATRSNASDEASGLRWPKKMFRQQKAASPHLPESPLHSSHSYVRRALLQTHGRTRDSLRDPRDAPILPWPLRAPRPAPERARQVPIPSKPRAKLAAASPTATDEFHKTTFRIDSLRARINPQASNSNAGEATH